MKLLTFIVFIPLVIGSAMPTVGAVIEQPSAYINPARPTRIVVTWGDPLPEYDFSPTWVDVRPGKVGTYDWNACDLPRREHWDEFADWAREVAVHYQAEYLGVMSKPEYTSAGYADYFGCVGDAHKYSEFVNFVADRVTGVKIIAGNVENLRGGFFQTMASLTHTHVDGYAIHCYASYVNGLINTCDERLEYAQSFAGGLPVYLTETAVLYKDNYDGGFEQAQAEYFEWLTASIDGPVFWYALDDSGYHANDNMVLCPSVACEWYRE